MQAVTITQITEAELEVIIERSVQRALSQQGSSQPANKALTIKPAAEYAQCADSTIRKAFRERKLKGHRQAGRLYFFEEDLKNWIKSEK